MKIKIECQYEIPVLRFAYITCTECGTRFDAKEHGKTESGGRIADSVDIRFGVFKCPECDYVIETRGRELDVEEE